MAGQSKKTDDEPGKLVDYIVNKTVTETIGIKAASFDDAENAIHAGQGNLISRNSNVSVRERTPADSQSANPAMVTVRHPATPSLS